MTKRIEHAELLAREEIAQHPAPRTGETVGFELPAAVYGAMAALLFGFMGVLAVGFAAPQMVVPMGINFAFLTAFFAVPVVFSGAGNAGSRLLRWSEFMRSGIQTATGHSSGGEAIVLVLLLPLLIFFWAMAIVTIANLV